MKEFPSRASRPRGFTLMELLVVIVIIGILAGLVFPVSKGVLERAKKTQAMNDCLQLKNAIAAYQTEYRRYPVAAGGKSGSESILDTDESLMSILMGADEKLNPRKIPFYTGKNATKSKVGGVVSTGSGSGYLVDPWGEFFGVVMDTDYNSRVADPSGGGTDIPQSIIIWSKGPDKDDYTDDDVKTW